MFYHLLDQTYLFGAIILPAAAANLYFYFWYRQLKLIYVAFLRQDHRAKCETISLFPLTTNNSIEDSTNKGIYLRFASLCKNSKYVPSDKARRAL